MKNYFLIILVALLALSSCRKDKVGEIDLPKGFIENDWDATLLAAQENDRNVFVHFYASWCVKCADLKENTLNDVTVEDYLYDNFVSASLDKEEGRGLELFEEHDLMAMPALCVFDKDGSLITVHYGKLDPAPFIEWIQEFE